MAQAILISVTVNAPNNVAVVPMTANDLQAILASAQTKIGATLTAIATAMNDFVIAAGGSVAYNSGTNQLSGTPAAVPAPTQAQLQQLLNDLNTALADFNGIGPQVTQAQNVTPGINGMTMAVDTTAIPNSATLSGTLQQALTFVRQNGILPA